MFKPAHTLELQYILEKEPAHAGTCRICGVDIPRGMYYCSRCLPPRKTSDQRARRQP